jgi:hypothetical protein
MANDDRRQRAALSDRGIGREAGQRGEARVETLVAIVADVAGNRMLMSCGIEMRPRITRGGAACQQRRPDKQCRPGDGQNTKAETVPDQTPFSIPEDNS